MKYSYEECKHWLLKHNFLINEYDRVGVPCSWWADNDDVEYTETSLKKIVDSLNAGDITKIPYHDCIIYDTLKKELGR